MIYRLHHLLAETALRYPERRAIASEAGDISYADLDQAAGKLARVLRDIGAEKGDRVGIYVRKSIEAVVSMFGILKAGCVYVPIDPLAPVERVGYIMANCGIRAVVSSADLIETGLQHLAASTPLRNLVLTGDTTNTPRPPSAQVVSWAEVLASDALAESVDGTVTDLAYLLYTSGSTGVPKGVMISHLAAFTFIDWSHDFVAMSPDDIVSSHAPLHFDLSIFDIFTTVKAGGTIVLVPPQAYTFPVLQSKFIAEQRISIWYSVPSALIQMITRGNFDRHDYPNLRWVLFAGEVFPVKYLRELRKMCGARMANLYGPTETNVCTYYEVTELAPDRTAPLPIGRAIANHEVFAVSGEQICTGPGDPGELWVRGPGLMSGYWGDREKTERVLVRNPFQPDFEEKVYRTGDLVSLDQQGQYLFLGRRDNMVKSRGYRIELGEIETTLYSHSSVSEAAVVAVPDDLVSNRIKAFVVPSEPSGCEEKALKAFCLTRLPHYMVPESIEIRSDLPKTSTGKIDKQSLIDGAAFSPSRVQAPNQRRCP